MGEGGAVVKAIAIALQTKSEEEGCGYDGHGMSCIISIRDRDDLMDHQQMNYYILFR